MGFLAEHSAWFDTEEYRKRLNNLPNKSAVCPDCGKSGRMRGACVVCTTSGHVDCFGDIDNHFVCRECRLEGD